MVASVCGLVVALMVGASYAAVPFYNWFCRVTGFNGTTQVASAAPQGGPLKRTIAVRFDSNVNGLPWNFEPETTEIEIPIGQVTTVYYKVTNRAAHETTGQAAYNVAPLTVGAYFQKINCFCFTDQTLGPGETRDTAGGVLCRSGARRRQRQRHAQQHHAVLHLLSGARAPRRSRWLRARPSRGRERSDRDASSFELR